MKKLFTLATLLACLALMTSTVFAEASVTRIKDIAKIQGVRSNQLMGYGLVVGLPGTGDSDDTWQMIQSTVSLLRNFGITVNPADLDSDNVAAVMVTATLPPFVREGDTIDVVVSSMGDADSIQGGVLLQTPLRAANGDVYAVAQGSVSTGGFVAGRGNNRAQRNFPTAGNIPNGAIVERTLEDELGRNGQISLSLASADFTTAARITNSINAAYGNVAHAANPGRVDINIPGYYRANVVQFVASIEDLPVVPDSIAKVVVNERTGTIVMGGNVHVDECAITQGGLSIRIDHGESASQPGPFSYGTSIVVKNTDVNAREEMSSSVVMPATTSVSDVIGALNAVGATPRDCISILQAMKAAGAIHAVLEII
ncbi:MAG: flagellar basal body P-ring protein FlgI [Selenomonadaceae bacterium]|nr:flagellar basal body P-ring protein FlgI [Selenomonadaceae bacterium]MBR6711619.1 flagellar basal body P-ring protein FlgI [Selenomonadaceae bacterium]